MVELGRTLETRLKQTKDKRFDDVATSWGAFQAREATDPPTHLDDGGRWLDADDTRISTNSSKPTTETCRYKQQFIMTSFTESWVGVEWCSLCMRFFLVVMTIHMSNVANQFCAARPFVLFLDCVFQFPKLLCQVLLPNFALQKKIGD